MTNTELAILILGLSVIGYFAYTKLVEVKENIEEKLTFF